MTADDEKPDEWSQPEVVTNSQGRRVVMIKRNGIAMIDPRWIWKDYQPKEEADDVRPTETDTD